MKNKTIFTTYGIFILIYVIFLIFSFKSGSDWFFDNVISISLLTLMFFLSGWMMITGLSFILFNLALFAHNLGAFGFYNYSIGWFEFDMFVHLFNAFVGAYLLSHFIVNKIKIQKSNNAHKHILNERRVLLALLIVSLIIFIGMLIELFEFTGFMFLGPGDGLLFAGSGDGNLMDVASQYIDTMYDVIWNITGSILGAALYYFTKKQH